ncbi:MAG TPA: NADH-quinone oxidoreductase subunit N [Pirellulales bacterium]|nr:NADH-quinone oxidoreductase subunit N [Pirellulales bacterium]
MTDSATLYHLLPEILLVAAATIIYLLGAFAPRAFQPSVLAAGAIVIAAAAAIYQDTHSVPVHTLDAWINGPFVFDLLGHAARWAILLFGFLFAVLTSSSRSIRPAAEYAGSLLLIVAGLMIVATAYDLVLMFLGLELVSIPTYILLYLGRRDPAGQEATAKYFFLSILSSALLLYGFSFLYGLAGNTRLDYLFNQLNAVPQLSDARAAMYLKLAPLAMLLVFAGLGFRMTAVPFHFYAPDVYQGTSHPNAGLLATLTKIAGLLALVRIVVASMPGAEMQGLGWRIALVMSVLTMTLGNVLALWQDNIRRLLAYSSIAHGGYILIGVAVGLATAANGDPSISPELNGVGTALFYLAVYCLATIAAFAALHYLGSQDRQVDGVDELTGLGRTRPLPALALAVAMFSLAGVPPLAGFWGKFTLFSGALEVGVPTASAAAGSGAATAVDALRTLHPWFTGLAVIGVLNAAIGMAYYLRVVATMYFRAPVTTIKAEGGAGPWIAMLFSTLLVVAAGVFPGPIVGAADRAGRAVQRPLAPTEQSDPHRRIAVPIDDGSLPTQGRTRHEAN